MRALNLSFALAFGCALQVRAQDSRAATRGEDVTLIGAHGPVRLSDFRGKSAVVLVFMRGFPGEFACYYCGEQTRDLKSHYEQIRAASAEVVMVLPLAKDIAGFLKKLGESAEPADTGFTVPFPVVLDPDGALCKAFGVPFDAKAPDFPVFEPATVVIGKDGKTLFEQHGKEPGDRPKAERVLEVLRTGSAKAVAKAPAKEPGSTRAWAAYTDGMRDAKAQRKPILLEFHAVW